MRKQSIIVAGVLLACILAFDYIATRRADVRGPWPRGLTMTCVVPWRAGGTADHMARQLIKYWEPELGATIRVENVDGFATLAGTEHFLAQPADGLHIYVGTQMYLSAGAILRPGEYDMDDFAIINFQQFDPVTLAVRSDSRFRTLEALVEEMRRRPGELRCGLVEGGAPHLASLIFKDQLELDFKNVVYDSGHAYRTALLGGDVDFVFSNANGDRAIKSGARVLAVADGKPSGIWPDAPIFTDIPGIEYFPNLGSARFVAVRSWVAKRHPLRFRTLVETYKKAFENPEYAAYRESVGEAEVSTYRGPERSTMLNRELHKLLTKYGERIAEDLRSR